MRPCRCVSKQPSTAGLLQGGQLQVRVLIPRGNAGVAKVHNSYFVSNLWHRQVIDYAAVSYTHLDVYKRQIMASLIFTVIK